MHSEFTIQQPAPFVVTELQSPKQTDLHLIFGHGWGQSGLAFLPLAEALKPIAPSFLIDFPGFGKSALPPETWGTADYADAVARWIEELPARQYIWIGHSFGCRVGLQLASRHPSALRAAVLIAAAGLQRHRTPAEKIRIAFRRTFFKTAKRLLGGGPRIDRLRQRIGSADYRSAGTLRPIFNRVVREDLTEIAKTVKCPTLIIYGSKDTDTPPEMGERLNRLIQGSEYSLLEGFGHLDILNEGRHQVALRIRRFLETRAQ
jgi:pimeloyl-ACP methyl ester carboxylesterase